MNAQEAAALRRHWRHNLAITVVLLTVWLLITLGTALFARELNRVQFFGVPLAFYVFSQGAPITFLLIIGVHARLMNRLDRRFAAARQHHGT